VALVGKAARLSKLQEKDAPALCQVSCTIDPFIHDVSIAVVPNAFETALSNARDQVDRSGQLDK